MSRWPTPASVPATRPPSISSRSATDSRPPISAYTVAFTTGIEIQTAGGILLAKADNFGRLEWQGRTKNYAVPAVVNVTLPVLKPGSYKLLVMVTDAASAKQASVTLPFAIVE